MGALPSRLSGRLLLAIVPVVLAAVTAIVWLQYSWAKAEILRAIDREVRLLAQRTADQVDEQLAQRHRDLLTLAETPLIADWYRNVDFKLDNEAESYRKELDRYLRRFAERGGAYAGAYFLDARGRYVAGPGALGRGGDESRLPHFVRAREAGADGWWTSPLVDVPDVGEALVFSRPVRDEQGFRGAVVLVYRLDGLRAELARIEVGRRGRAYLDTQTGRRLEGRPAAEPGLERLAASQTLNRRQWEVTVEAPLADFLGPLQTVRDAALLTTAVGAALLVGLLLLLVRSITRPIAELVTAARAVGAGYLSHRIARVGGDELGELAGAFNDMTERLEKNSRENTRLQAQLIQAEKLSAVGQLISSVAHELNNPLGAVSGYAQMALLLDDCPPQLRSDLERVQINVGRCRKVVDNLLLFVRRSRGERRKVDLNAAVRAAIELLEYRLVKTEAVKVELDLTPEPAEAAGDFQQLVQVLVNLVSNACDAMQDLPRGGKRLAVRTRRRPEGLEVEVEDNGPGVPAELQPKLFEAFFTTKEPGRGTGLGLSICRQIADAHGGAIEFSSAEGRGCLFRLRLPTASAAELDGLDEEEAVPEPAPVPGKRVLAVDDEEDIARLIARVLREDGDEVDVALDGDEALAAVERTRYDLVISDIGMGRVKGTDLHSVLAKRGAGPRMLFVTGDMLNPDVLAFFERTGCEYLVKPFDVAELRRAARRLLSLG